MSKTNLKQLIETVDINTIEHSKQWYVEARDFAQGLAMQYDITLSQAAQVIAALSPAVKWERNKQDATNVIQCWALGGTPEDVTVCTYGANKKKAFAILDGDTVINQKTSPKTYAFAHNIQYPYTSELVTVDRHAVKAYKGKQTGGREVIGAPLYRKVERAYRVLAEKEGLTPPALQAIVWVAYKEKVGR